MSLGKHSIEVFHPGQTSVKVFIAKSFHHQVFITKFSSPSFHHQVFIAKFSSTSFIVQRVMHVLGLNVVTDWFKIVKIARTRLLSGNPPGEKGQVNHGARPSSKSPSVVEVPEELVDARFEVVGGRARAGQLGPDFGQGGLGQPGVEEEAEESRKVLGEVVVVVVVDPPDRAKTAPVERAGARGPDVEDEVAALGVAVLVGKGGALLDDEGGGGGSCQKTPGRVAQFRPREITLAIKGVVTGTRLDLALLLAASGAALQDLV
jgi:hypothetical protein